MESCPRSAGILKTALLFDRNMHTANAYRLNVCFAVRESRENPNFGDIEVTTLRTLRKLGMRKADERNDRVTF